MKVRSRVAFTRLTACCFLLLTLLCLSQPVYAQQSNPATDSPEASSSKIDLFDLLKKATAIGGALTAVAAFIKQAKELSKRARRKATLREANELKSFISSWSTAGNLTDQQAVMIGSARDELDQIVSSFNKPQSPPGKLRQAILIYIPPSWDAWIYQFAFYTVVALAVIFLVAFFTDPETHDSLDILSATLTLTGIGALAQRAAALRLRQRLRITSIPRKIGGPLCWYRANNLFGLLANGMVVVGLATLCTAAPPLRTDLPYWPMPHWQLVIREILGCASIPLGYLWAAAEFSMYKSRRREQSALKIWNRIRHENDPILHASLTTLSLLVIWTTTIAIVNCAQVKKFALLPNSDGDPCGFLWAAIAIATFVALSGVLPTVAVYRGTSAYLSSSES